MRKGLYSKYKVINRETEREVESESFILKPDDDIAARIAIRAYAESTKNQELADDLRRWLTKYPCRCGSVACAHNDIYRWSKEL